MCWFKKKKIYKVVWKYDSTSTVSYTELVKAYDEADAWRLIRKKHSVAITLDSMEETKNGKV